MYSRVIVEPPVEPITLAETKLHLSVDHDLRDDEIGAFIQAAREHVEKYCLRSIVTQTRETSFDCFTGNLELPYGPVQEIVSVSYADAVGSTTALTTDDYQAFLNRSVPVVTPPYGSAWPTAVGTLDVVTVRYVAGYAPVAGSPTDYRTSVPSALKTAMKLLVGNWFKNKEATAEVEMYELPLAVCALLAQYKLSIGMA